MSQPLRTAHTLLYWMAFAGLLVLGAVVFIYFGLLDIFIEQDSSRLSLVILAGLIVATGHAGYRAYQMDQEFRAATLLGDDVEKPHRSVNSSIARDYAQMVEKALANGRDRAELANLGAYLEQRIHAGHASGWFIADLMIKLGLLGTVIGFIFMLNAVAQMETTDLNAAKLMLTQMSSGMRIALFTTLAGLSSGLILGAQYQLLDRSADHLFSLIVSIVDTGAATSKPTDHSSASVS